MSPCRRCSRQMIPVAEWRGMDQKARKAARAQRQARAGSRGLCAACHQWARDHDRLEDFALLRSVAVRNSTWVLCRRCGAERVESQGLCADCRDVVHDLTEARAWVR